MTELLTKNANLLLKLNNLSNVADNTSNDLAFDSLIKLKCTLIKVNKELKTLQALKRAKKL